MISNRTKFSLSLFLSLQDLGFLRTLLYKHDISTYDVLSEATSYSPLVMDYLRQSILWASPENLMGLLAEIARTGGDLRSRITPRYKYDERWDDLIRCLQLDNYIIESENLISIEPSIEGIESPEDALSEELNRSGLEKAAEVKQLIKDSSNNFRQNPPDLNACLTKARVAIQTLATSIAQTRLPNFPGSFDPNKWGEVLAYLRTSGFITEQEEKGISGSFTFVSPGAHRPVGFSEEEMTRLGRNLIISMCYFLIKLHNS